MTQHLNNEQITKPICKFDKKIPSKVTPQGLFIKSNESAMI